MSEVKYKLFWDGPFSNWHRSPFIKDGMEFLCVEQWMMYSKAILFDDLDSAAAIMEEMNPRNQKRLGRQVSGYNNTQWGLVRYELVKSGLRDKFLQNRELYEYLKKYEGYQIVEASPEDAIWGVGYGEKDALKNIENWGQNLLGKMLTELSVEL
jgi:ribA/ribD-fused uncharacterized protein